MTDKEFKRLSRSELIDIIYQFQLQVDELTEQNKELERVLKDKRIRLSNAGNIAEAALEINNCFRNAQDAAEQYLNEIRAIREETEKERLMILEKAKSEASAIILGATETRDNYYSATEKILKEIKDNQTECDK